MSNTFKFRSMEQMFADLQAIADAHRHEEGTLVQLHACGCETVSGEKRTLCQEHRTPQARQVRLAHLPPTLHARAALRFSFLTRLLRANRYAAELEIHPTGSRIMVKVRGIATMVPFSS